MSDVAAHPAQARTAALTDLGTMAGRCLRLSSRSVDAMVTALALPVIILLLFVYLFGGAIHTGVSYVDYVVPGAMLVCAGFGVGSTAVSVSQDLAGGVVDRFRSMDVRDEVIVAGHVVASVLRNLVSTLLVVAVAVPVGFRSHAPVTHWLVAGAVFAFFVLALSWVCAALGVLAASPEAATGMTFLISFLPYPSSAFVPIHTMPSWLQGFAAHQPATCVIDSVRGLLLGGVDWWVVGQALLWSGGITVAGVLATGAAFRSRTR